MAEDLRTEQQIVEKFQELRQNVDTLWNKLNDLETESTEHDLVIKQLEPLEPGRKCFRLIGEVLVERTVQEILPAVKRNRDKLREAMHNVEKLIQQKQGELKEFQTKYKIRMRGEDGDEDDETAGPSSSGSGQGVMVSRG